MRNATRERRVPPRCVVARPSLATSGARGWRRPCFFVRRRTNAPRQGITTRRTFSLWGAIAVAFVWFAPGASAQGPIAPAVASGFEVEDFLQTTYCLQFYPSCREENAALGPHPSTFHLGWYDGLWIASQWLVPKTI